MEAGGANGIKGDISEGVMKGASGEGGINEIKGHNRRRSESLVVCGEGCR